MASIKFKRSSVAGKVPATTDLELGQLAINTYDGTLFTKKDNGTESIVTINGVSGPTASVNNSIAIFDGTTGKLLKDSGTLLSTKQDTLVSGVNIKTINNISLLGSGNISISGGGSSSLATAISLVFGR